MLVYKYKLNCGFNALTLPTGSQLLKVAFQGSEIVLWALIPSIPGGSKDEFMIHVAFTGEKFNHDGPVTYISSDENANGIVIHAFELG